MTVGSAQGAKPPPLQTATKSDFAEWPWHAGCKPDCNYAVPVGSLRLNAGVRRIEGGS